MVKDRRLEPLRLVLLLLRLCFRRRQGNGPLGCFDNFGRRFENKERQQSSWEEDLAGKMLYS